MTLSEEGFPAVSQFFFIGKTFTVLSLPVILPRQVGHLLVYTIRDNPSSPSADAGRFIVTLAKSCKNFAKKPIVQLQVVPEFHLLLCLADATVSVYDLRCAINICNVYKSRGSYLKKYHTSLSCHFQCFQFDTSDAQNSRCLSACCRRPGENENLIYRLLPI